MTAYILVFIGGVLILAIQYINKSDSNLEITYDKTGFFYFYEFFIICVFLSQIPFSYIIYRLIAQSKVS